MISQRHLLKDACLCFVMYRYFPSALDIKRQTFRELKVKHMSATNISH